MAGFQAPSTASFGVGSNLSVESLPDSSPLRVVAGSQGAASQKAAVPATSGTEALPSLHMPAAGPETAGQHLLAKSAASPDSTDQSWILELEAASTGVGSGAALGSAKGPLQQEMQDIIPNNLRKAI